MPNPYYTPSGYPSTGAAGSSASMRSELAAVSAGFDLMPVLSGNAGKYIAVNAGGSALTVSSILSEAGGALTVAGGLSVTGSVTLGDASVDALVVAPSSVTWSNNPTHSGAHTWSGNQTWNGTNVLNSGTVNQVVYLNSSKQLAGNAGFTFDGTYLAATMLDTGFALKDTSDPSKTATFELSGITAGQTRAYTVPDVSGTLATLANISQTFTGTTVVSGTFTATGQFASLGTSTGATTVSVGTGSTTTGLTKTVNIGTGGSSGSTTSIALGSNVAGSTTNIVFNSGGGAAGQFTGGVFSLNTALAVSSGGTGAATLTGVVKGNGTSAFTAGNVNLASEVTGTLPVANGGTGTTTSTGSGNVVLSTSPTLTTPNLGTPSAATLTNATGLPLSTGVTGTLPVANGGTGITAFGTGVATALGQSVTGSGGIVLATNPTIDGATFTGNAQTTPVTVTFSATAMTVNCDESNVFATTFTANVTTAPTISNPKNGQTINWFITQDATGGRTMTWPSSFRWPSGATRTLSTAANSVDLLVATYLSSTGFWYASLSKGFTA